jgi:hypothetical protein
MTAPSAPAITIGEELASILSALNAAEDSAEHFALRAQAVELGMNFRRGYRMSRGRVDAAIIAAVRAAETREELSEALMDWNYDQLMY